MFVLLAIFQVSDRNIPMCWPLARDSSEAVSGKQFILYHNWNGKLQVLTSIAFGF